MAHRNQSLIWAELKEPVVYNRTSLIWEDTDFPKAKSLLPDGFTLKPCLALETSLKANIWRGILFLVFYLSEQRTIHMYFAMREKSLLYKKNMFTPHLHTGLWFLYKAAKFSSLSKALPGREVSGQILMLYIQYNVTLHALTHICRTFIFYKLSICLT